jgi:hypothetical protein
MTNQQFEDALKEVYDNLIKEQFDFLLERCKLKINQLVYTDGLLVYDNAVGFSRAVAKTKDDISEVTVVAANVFNTVRKTRKISFKQFKMMSLISETNWFSNNDETEYKQF